MLDYVPLNHAHKTLRKFWEAGENLLTYGIGFNLRTSLSSHWEASLVLKQGREGVYSILGPRLRHVFFHSRNRLTDWPETPDPAETSAQLIHGPNPHVPPSCPTREPGRRTGQRPEHYWTAGTVTFLGSKIFIVREAQAYNQENMQRNTWNKIHLWRIFFTMNSSQLLLYVRSQFRNKWRMRRGDGGRGNMAEFMLNSLAYIGPH